MDIAGYMQPVYLGRPDRDNVTEINDPNFCAAKLGGVDSTGPADDGMTRTFRSDGSNAEIETMVRR